MSTKTTFKRIALVTVAALGFGVMSVVPSNAATQVDTNTLSAATATMQTQGLHHAGHLPGRLLPLASPGPAQVRAEQVLLLG